MAVCLSCESRVIDGGVAALSLWGVLRAAGVFVVRDVELLALTLLDVSEVVFNSHHSQCGLHKTPSFSVTSVSLHW